MDVLLAAALLLLVPGFNLWRSHRSRRTPPEDRLKRYWRTMGLAGALLLFLAIDWLLAERPLVLLGLAVRPSLAGWIGLAVAFVTLAALGLLARRFRKSADEATEWDALVMLPQNATELRVFVLFAVVIGFAWEVLFRGFLLWFLTPLLGIVGAVLIAATAYGLAHGYKSPRQLIGSLVAALLFTAAYALTGSLWWLVVVHIGLPLLGVTAARRRHLPAIDAVE